MHTCDMQENKIMFTIYDGASLWSPILENEVMLGVLSW